MAGKNQDDQYRNATQAVDDAMRMDVLGPKVVEVIEKFTPASESISTLTYKAIKNDSDVRVEINNIIDSRLTTRKGRGISKLSWQIGIGLILALAGGLIGHFLS